MKIKKIGDFWVNLLTGNIYADNPCINTVSMEKFSFQSIGGMQFNVQAPFTNELMTVKVIKAELLYEIIRAHTLLLDDPRCTVTQLLDLFTGFVGSPYHVSWYTTTNPADIPVEAVKQAALEGNQIVIAEVIAVTNKEEK